VLESGILETVVFGIMKIATPVVRQLGGQAESFVVLRRVNSKLRHLWSDNLMAGRILRSVQLVNPKLRHLWCDTLMGMPNPRDFCIS
jgi:hypothetical protein